MEDIAVAIRIYLGIVIIIIGFFLLFREIVLWYFNINTIIEKQTKSVNVLHQILEELQKGKPMM